MKNEVMNKDIMNQKTSMKERILNKYAKIIRGDLVNKKGRENDHKKENPYAAPFINDLANICTNFSGSKRLKICFVDSIYQHTFRL
jgi:hypothetical protein